MDKSIHSVVACANNYGLFSLDEIEAESKARGQAHACIGSQYVVPPLYCYSTVYTARKQDAVIVSRCDGDDTSPVQ